MDETVTLVTPPNDPEETRKKGLRTPDETIELAKQNPGEGVVHSVGHTTANAARSAVKRIQAGRFSAWRKNRGKLRAFVVPYDDDTWGVAVVWKGGEEK